MIPLRTLRLAAAHTVIATLLALTLGLAGILLIGGASGLGSLDRLLEGQRVAWRLQITDPEDPRLAEIVEEAEERLADVEPPPGVRTMETDEGVWLVVDFAEQEHAPRGRDVSEMLGARDVWTGRVRIDSPAKRWLAELLEDPGGTLATFAPALVTLLVTGGLGWIVAGLFFRWRHPVAGWERARRSFPLLLTVGAAVGLAASGLGTLVGWLMAAAGFEAVEQEWVTALANGPGAGLLVLLMVGVVIAPLGEELFFRGHLFRMVSDRENTPWAYAISVGAFAGLHFNPSALPLYLLYGILLAWAYDRWRSLVVPITAHATINAIAIVLLTASG